MVYWVWEYVLGFVSISPSLLLSFTNFCWAVSEELRWQTVSVVSFILAKFLNSKKGVTPRKKIESKFPVGGLIVWIFWWNHRALLSHYKITLSLISIFKAHTVFKVCGFQKFIINTIGAAIFFSCKSIWMMVKALPKSPKKLPLIFVSIISPFNKSSMGFGSHWIWSVYVTTSNILTLCYPSNSTCKIKYYRLLCKLKHCYLHGQPNKINSPYGAGWLKGGGTTQSKDGTRFSWKGTELSCA